MNQSLEQQVANLTKELQNMKQLLATHQHCNDGTIPLRKNIMLDRDQWLAVGSSQVITGQPQNQGQVSELYNLAISEGPDPVTDGFVYKSNNMQMNFYHQPNSDLSFMWMFRKPLVSSVAGISLSISSAGNTVTIPGYNFTSGELIGAVIYIQNSSGTTISASTISGNTSTVITIDGTWGVTASNCTFGIYRTVYLGSAETIWQRGYFQEGTAGGIRFGMGATAGGRNGLLYMDATGDLYWRNKGGTSTKLN